MASAAPMALALFLLLLLPQLCFAMNADDYDGTVSTDESAINCYGFLPKMRRWLSLSDLGTICDTYSILPRNSYKILLIFGEFDSIYGENLKKIEISTDDQGNFRWNFDEMVAQNKEVTPKNDQKVTVLLYHTVKDEYRTFRVYDTYAQMREKMEENEGRFDGCFQVMFEHWQIWKKAEKCGETSKCHGQEEAQIAAVEEKHRQTEEADSPIGYQQNKQPEVPLSTFPAHPLPTSSSSSTSGKEEEEEEEEKQGAIETLEEEMPLLLGVDGHKKYGQHHQQHHSLRHRRVGEHQQMPDAEK